LGVLETADPQKSAIFFIRPPQRRVNLSGGAPGFIPTPIYIVAAKLKKHPKTALAGFRNAQ